MTERLINAVNRIHSDEKGPFYLFDTERLYSRYDELDNRLKAHLGEGSYLVYAIKANPFLTRYMDRKVKYFEVCSPGEFEICCKNNISTEKIVFSGVYKSKDNIRRIFENGFDGVVTLESPNHYALLKEVMDERSVSNVRILPRLSSGNKFGMDEDAIIAIVKDALSDGRLHIEGIQFFSGTQKKKIKVIQEELAKIDSFCERLKAETGYATEFVEYGPGFFYDYFSQMDDMSLYEEVLTEIAEYADKYTFALESGRFLAAECGEYVTEIVDIKNTYDKNYLLVDGGIHHVNYYGRMLGMNVPKVDHLKASGDAFIVSDVSQGEEYEVTGALCTVSDVLLKNYVLDNPECGDLLVFHDVGAYSCTEAGVLFLSRALPGIYALLPEGDIVMHRDCVESHELNT